LPIATQTFRSSLSSWSCCSLWSYWREINVL